MRVREITNKAGNILLLIYGKFGNQPVMRDKQEKRRREIQREYEKKYGKTRRQQAKNELDEYMREGGKYTLANYQDEGE